MEEVNDGFFPLPPPPQQIRHPICICLNIMYALKLFRMYKSA